MIRLNMQQVLLLHEELIQELSLIHIFPQTIFLEPGVTRTVRFFNAVKPSLTVIKRNSITKDPLENAKFHIYYASDNTETGEINDLGTYYTDSSGPVSYTHLDVYKRQALINVSQTLSRNWTTRERCWCFLRIL